MQSADNRIDGVPEENLSEPIDANHKENQSVSISATDDTRMVNMLPASMERLDGLQISSVDAKQRHTVILELKKGENFPKTDTFGLCDPYVCATVLGSGVVTEDETGRMMLDHNTKSTHTLKKTLGKVCCTPKGSWRGVLRAVLCLVDTRMLVQEGST